MNSGNPYLLDESVIEQYLALQSQSDYVRSVDGDQEPVIYPPGSTVRIWYNNENLPYDLHWHTAIEILIPLEGPYVIHIAQKTYTLNPGDILIIPSGDLHQIDAPQGGSRFIIMFEYDLLSRIKGSSYLGSFLSKPVLMNRSICAPVFDREAGMISRICRDYLRADGLKELVLYSELMRFLIYYAQYKISMEQELYGRFSEKTQKDYAEKFNEAFVYLDEHFAEDLTLEDVAGVVGFSKYHFSRAFKQYSGYNFYDYLSRKRIRSAEALLQDPKLSITDVALQSGFSCVGTFNRVFRKIRLCTPTEYRKLLQNQVSRT